LTRLEARQTLLKEKKEALFPRMKRAKILVAILIVSSVVIVHAGNQSSPAAPMQVLSQRAPQSANVRAKPQ
jgi:hypothetical protein